MLNDMCRFMSQHLVSQAITTGKVIPTHQFLQINSVHK